MAQPDWPATGSTGPSWPPCGSTHRLNIFLNPELCFAVLISLQHNVPVSPLLSSCSLITRPPPSIIFLWSWEKKTAKKKKKNLWGNICLLWQRHRWLFWVFFIIIILFQCDMSFRHEILQSCYWCGQREKKSCEMGFCLKTIFNKGRTNPTKSFF